MPTDVDLFSLLLVTSQTIPSDHRHTVIKELEKSHCFPFLAAFTAGWMQVYIYPCTARISSKFLVELDF